MQYTFTSPTEGTIEVPLERWIWGALYKDGSEIHQFDKDGKFHQIGEIEQEKVQLWVLYKAEGEGRIDFIVPEGAKLIHKYRNIVIAQGTPEERKVRVYMFGYKHEGRYHYNFVLPDDRIVQAVDENIQLMNFNI